MSGLCNAGARTLLACAWWLLASHACAGSLGVSPIRIDLKESAPTSAVTLSNRGSTAMVLQLQLMRWSAEDTRTHYEPSDDLLATPPIMSIAPGKSQIVRIGLRKALASHDELSYRLFIEEVPPPAQPGYQGLQMALRVSVPVFVQPAQPVQPLLRWSLVKDGGQPVALRVSNQGNGHARLLDLQLRFAGGEREVALREARGYLLPGQSNQWRLAPEHVQGVDRWQVGATTDQGTVDAELALSDP
jgi:fimbrial chaperone protein